jgi:ribonuclease R
MLAANSAVGDELIERGIAGIFRVHPEPDPEKLAEFIENVAAHFGLAPGNLSNRSECRRFIESLPDDPRRPVILSMFLRSLPRAYYLEKSELHFGLGKHNYCHFTSPIRRYPDLAVHQQLWNSDLKQRIKSAAHLAEIAAECSAREENNDDAYFAATDRLKLRYLAEKLETSGENFYEGVIARVNNNGLLADIPEIGIYGFIPRENLGANFRRRPDGRFRSDRGHIEYKPGDYVYLKLSQIDPVRGAAEFKPVSR